MEGTITVRQSRFGTTGCHAPGFSIPHLRLPVPLQQSGVAGPLLGAQPVDHLHPWRQQPVARKAGAPHHRCSQSYHPSPLLRLQLRAVHDAVGSTGRHLQRSFLSETHGGIAKVPQESLSGWNGAQGGHLAVISRTIRSQLTYVVPQLTARWPQVTAGQRLSLDAYYFCIVTVVYKIFKKTKEKIFVYK